MQEAVFTENIKLVKKQFSEYVKLILEQKYVKSINDAFLDNYINVRYYDIDQTDKTIKNKVFDNLEQIEKILLKKNEKQKEKIENTYKIYLQLVYLDDLVPNKNIEKVAENLVKIKEDIFKVEYKELKVKILEINNKNQKEIKGLIKRYETEDFYLKFSNYMGFSNLVRVNLKYNIEFPMIFSEMAIKKAFETDVTNENRLFVEYNLINLKITQEIKKGNFSKQYILEYAPTLLKKQQKNSRLLKVLDDPIIQEKTCLKIKFSEFSKQKEEVYELMRNGFKFAVILDSTFKPTLNEIEKLNVFEHILIHSNDENIKILRKNTSKIKNIVEL